MGQPTKLIQMKQSQPKLRGAYVVSEAKCLDVNSGANHHINAGFAELSKYLEMELLHPGVPEKAPRDHRIALKNPEHARGGSAIRAIGAGRLGGSLRDLKVLYSKLFQALHFMRCIRKSKPDFVYLRASYLDVLPFLLFLCKIPYFVEANGRQFDSRKRHYSSWLLYFNWLVERTTYRLSCHTFFVGSYGLYWGLRGDNWSNVENGIEQSFVHSFERHEKKVTDVINIVLIARLMPHHKPELITRGFKGVPASVRHRLRLNLVGSGLDRLVAELEGVVEVRNHGFLDRGRLCDCLSGMQIGLISGGPPFSSQMKLFDYGAAKCLVIAPRLPNLEYWFDSSEIEFFDPESHASLSAAIVDAVNDYNSKKDKGSRLFRRIKDEFTWENIFAAKVGVITSCLHPEGSPARALQ